MRILIIGGYGNFGRYIAKTLSKRPDLEIIIAGRSVKKAQEFAESIKARWIFLDTGKNLNEVLRAQKPDIVINTSGPFQGQGYDVALSCIDNRCHYIDLADGREFVESIKNLDQSAKNAGVAVISGASSVPCLTSSIVDDHLQYFKVLESIDYGIATAQKTNPGQATTAAILEYTGKAFTTLLNSSMTKVYGWQDLTIQKYPELGYRLLGNCDIPDLALFPERYKDLKNLTFKAGLEVPFLHLGLWALSWLVRARMIKSLKPFTNLFYHAGRLFDIFGTDRSGFHIIMTGIDHDNKTIRKTFYIVTGSSHGPNIPCIPSILLTRMIADGEFKYEGAMPCIGIIPLQRYLDALSELDIKYFRE